MLVLISTSQLNLRIDRTHPEDIVFVAVLVHLAHQVAEGTIQANDRILDSNI
jgi:hypothetical protein